jgi:putative ABC transport system substrate-binding protein
MDRRAFLGTLGLLATPLATGAQPAGTVHHVGYIGWAAEHPVIAAFKQYMQDRGYPEGRNIRFTYRGPLSGRDANTIAAWVDELVRLKVDVLVTLDIPATRAAKAATATVPIVFLVPDAVEMVASGLASSHARPGGNLTGFTIVVPGFTGKQLQLLKEMVPRAKRIGILVSHGSPARLRNESDLRESQAAADGLGIRLQVFNARTVEDIDRFFASATAKATRVDAIHVYGDSFLNRYLDRIVALAKTHRLPAMYFWPGMVRQSGGLMSFGPHWLDLHRRVAGVVDKILKGARPADIPVEEPTKHLLTINVRTARELGLTVPPSLLARADEVIE